jgi:hypothetical protein
MVGEFERNKGRQFKFDPSSKFNRFFRPTSREFGGKTDASVT